MTSDLDNRFWAVLVLTCAFIWGLCFMAGYSLNFPVNETLEEGSLCECTCRHDSADPGEDQ